MSIWDIRFTLKPSITFDEALKILAFDEWKTIKGAHVEIGEGGEILHGMGGKFKKLSDVPRKTVKQRKGESIEQTKERAQEVFKQQDEAKAAAEKERKAKEAEAIAKAEAEEKEQRDKAFRENRAKLKEARLKRDWDADPPEGVEDWFIKKEVSAGRLSSQDASDIRSSGVMPEVRRQTEKALLLRWYSPVDHVNISAWVPKSVCMNSDEYSAQLLQMERRY